MQKEKFKIFVPYDVLKNEIKTIQKQTNTDLKFTELLNIVISFFNFKDYNEYKILSKKQIDNVDIRYYKLIPIYDLTSIENNIIKHFNRKLNINIEKLFFIRNAIQEKFHNFTKKEKTLNILQFLSVYRNIDQEFFDLLCFDEYKYNEKIYICKSTLQKIFEQISLEKENIKLFESYKNILENNYPVEYIENLIAPLNDYIESTHSKIIARLYKNSLKNLINDEKNGEGLFFYYIFKYYLKEINLETLHSILEKKVNIEQKEYELELITIYNKNINSLDFNIPDLIYEQDDNDFVFYKNITNYNTPLYLGKELIQKSNVFNLKKENNLILNIEEAKANKVISGSCGSGKSYLSYSIISQHIFNNKSVIYFAGYEQQGIHVLYNQCIKADRKKDIYFFNINDSFLNKKLIEAYKKNGIIFIISSHHPTHIELEDFNKLAKLIKNIDFKNNNNNYLNNIIVFEEQFNRLNFSYENKNILNNLKYLSIISLIQSYCSSINNFKEFIFSQPFHIFMKQEDPHSINYSFPDTEELYREVISLNAGQFYTGYFNVSEKIVLSDKKYFHDISNINYNTSSNIII